MEGRHKGSDNSHSIGHNTDTEEIDKIIEEGKFEETLKEIIVKMASIDFKEELNKIKGPNKKWQI